MKLGQYEAARTPTIESPLCWCRASTVKEAASTPNLAPDNGSREAAKGSAVRHHALVRAAVKALADSDEFIEVLVRELEKSGLLQDNPTLS